MWAEKALVSIQEKASAIFSICIFLFSPFSRASANPTISPFHVLKYIAVKMIANH